MTFAPGKRLVYSERILLPFIEKPHNILAVFCHKKIGSRKREATKLAALEKGKGGEIQHWFIYLSVGNL